VRRIHGNQVRENLQRQVVLNGGPTLSGELIEVAKNAMPAHSEESSVQEHAVLIVDNLIEENCEEKRTEE